MSAGALGAELLSELKEQRLDQFLYELRALRLSRSRYHVGVPAIDELIDIFTPSINVQRLQAQHSTQWIPAAHTGARPRKTYPDVRAPVIELTGVTSCPGKSQLLYYILATMILPKILNGITLPGKERAVVVLDLSSDLSLMRLNTMMEHLVRGSPASAEIAIQDHDAAALAKQSLQHLHVFRPQSHPSLLATIAALPSYFFSDTTSHYSANRQVGAIVINSLSAFFWQDRQDAEEQKDAALIEPSAMAQDQKANVYLTRGHTLVKSLSEVQQTFDCPIIATNWALASPAYSNSGSSLRPHLPAIWANFCTFNIVLQRNSVRKFGPGLSVEEALAEKDQRQEAVDGSGFTGWVNCH
ncbi:MAG: hypothetical protein Q9191_001232 [Dirinaria sp. TL-2023a]